LLQGIIPAGTTTIDKVMYQLTYISFYIHYLNNGFSNEIQYQRWRSLCFLLGSKTQRKLTVLLDMVENRLFSVVASSDASLDAFYLQKLIG
jgi:hypothetical protein